VATRFRVAEGERFDDAVCRTDEDPRCQASARYECDRYGFIEELFRLSSRPAS
jgi:hypothetical protein